MKNTFRLLLCIPALFVFVAVLSCTTVPEETVFFDPAVTVDSDIGIAAFKGSTYAVFIDDHDRVHLLAGSEDGSFSSPPMRLFNGWQTAVAPDLCTFRDRLYITFTGYDGRLFIASSDNGRDWPHRPEYIFREHKGHLYRSMRLEEFDGVLYCTFIGTDNRVYIASSSDGKEWPDRLVTPFPDIASGSEADLVSAGSSLLIGYADSQFSLRLAESPDGVDWPEHPPKWSRSDRAVDGVRLVADGDRRAAVFTDEERRINILRGNPQAGWEDVPVRLDSGPVARYVPAVSIEGRTLALRIVDSAGKLKGMTEDFHSPEAGIGEEGRRSVNRKGYPFRFTAAIRDRTDSREANPAEQPGEDRRYAGLFSEEDLAGRSILDYRINLPVMHRPFYSTDYREYFCKDDESGKMSYQLYYEDLRKAYYEYELEDPYRKEDRAFRDAVVADDRLNTDEKLELIVKSHKGLIRNLDIDALVRERMEVLEPAAWEALFLERFFSGSEEAARKEFRTDERFERSAFFKGQTVVSYKDVLYIGYDPAVHADAADQALDLMTAFIVLEYRLPAIAPTLLGLDDSFITLANFEETDSLGSAGGEASPTKKMFLLNLNHEKFITRPSYVHFLDTLLHESIHNLIRYSLHEFDSPPQLASGGEGLILSTMDRGGSLRAAVLNGSGMWQEAVPPPSPAENRDEARWSAVLPVEILPGSLRTTRFEGKEFAAFYDRHHRLCIAAFPTDGKQQAEVARLYQGWNSWAPSDIESFNGRLYVTFSGGDGRIFIDSSADGFSWNHRPRHLFDGYFVDRSREMQLEEHGGQLYLAYADRDGHPAAAVSPDGVNWPAAPGHPFNRAAALSGEPDKAEFLLWEFFHRRDDLDHIYTNEFTCTLNERIVSELINGNIPDGASLEFYVNKAAEEEFEVDLEKVMPLFPLE